MTAPTNRDEDALDERYRRARAAAPATPDAAVRAAILAEGRRIADGQRRARAPARLGTGRAAANDRRWVLGALVAAVIAGLIVIPMYRERPQPPGASASRAPAFELRSQLPVAPQRVGEPAPPAAPGPQAAPAPAARGSARPPAAAQAERRVAESPSVALPIVAGPPPPAAIVAPAADAAPSLAAKSAGARALVAAPAAAVTARAAADPAASLRRAIAAGDVARVRQLLEGGASLTDTDADGQTPLLLATVAGRAAVVSLLLGHGADPNVPGRDGRTPLAEARARHLDEIVAALERAGAR
jgi:hypothetical protein